MTQFTESRDTYSLGTVYALVYKNIVILLSKMMSLPRILGPCSLKITPVLHVRKK